MSNWGGETSSQPPGQSQITFFDPSKFQNTGNFPTVPTSQQNSVQGQGQTGNHTAVNNQESGQNAWNSWGTWDAKANPYAGDFNAGGDQVNNDQTVNNDYGNYNQQQWYGQWNNAPQNSEPGTGQWDPNTQWDPNQQWNQQYNYEQGAEQPQNTEYNNYWTGQNGGYQSEVNYQNFDFNGQSASSAGYFGQDPNVIYAQAGGNYMKSGEDGNIQTDSEIISAQTDRYTGDLNVSQSTESGNQSLNQSSGNVEDGGTVGGFFNNDDYDEEEEDSDDDEEEEEEEGEEEKEGDELSNENDSNLVRGASHIQYENKFSTEHVDNAVISSSQIPQSELSVTDQIQSLTIQDASQTSDNQCKDEPNIPLYSNQRNDGKNVPLVPQVQQHSFLPPHTEIQSGEANAENSNADDGIKHETPTFSDHGDWEMVPPPHGNMNTHSRNTSMDNNVHFFISSTNSSARVSPASSKTGEDRVGNVHEEGSDKKEESVPKHETGADNVQLGQTSAADKADHQNLIRPPPVEVGASLGPPPSVGIGNKGVNPFRKSPNMEATSSSSTNDASMLSSTRLDVTRPNFENSPVVLNQSISPITALQENTIQADNEITDLPALKTSGHLPDTPVSTQSRKSAAVQQSPILPRKESPFQPPKQGNKPVKASNNIPGVVPENTTDDVVKSGPFDKKERRTPDRELDKGSYGRKTPDRDSSDRRNESRRSEKDIKRRSDKERGYEERDRYYRDRDRYGPDSDRVTSRPPPGSGTNDRGSTRTRQSAFHHIQTNRSKNNVSPAASLLDVVDSAPAMPNILLMPASGTAGTVSQNASVSAPSELTPVVSLISSLSSQITTDNSVEDKKVSKNDKENNRDKDSKDRYQDKDRYGYRDDRSRYNKDRDREKGSKDELRGNRSYDSLRERGLRDSRNNSREKLYDSRDSLDRDDSRERSRRGDSRERDRSYRDEYYDRYRDRNRPPSRTSTIDTRRDYRDRDRDRDREYYRRSDRYDRDRPRSRQGDRDRAGSRLGESDRPRSRTDYDREIERYREKYRGYNYEDYYKHPYYDRQYYDYYHGYYNQGYYDDQGYYHPDPAAQRYHYDQYQRRSRTGTPGSLSDGGEEISSIAEKKKRSDSESDKKRFDYPPDLHSYSQRAYDDYYSYYGYEQNGHRWDPDISAWVATTTEVTPQRQTPEKFMIPHVRACFGPNGQLVKVLPNRPADGQPATIEIHDVQVMLEENTEAEQLSQFPGPLVRGETHKNDILIFCQNKAKLCSENMSLEDRDSAELIWKFLELLIKQNGTIVGTDIADLILQGHEPTTQDYRRSGMKIAASADNLEVDDESEDSQSQKLSRGSTPIDRSLAVDRSVIAKGRSVEEVTDRFRHLLMYGRKKDALDWAMKNNLWGHALFLASKMDSRAHADVMKRFANVAMRMNDPLQTLYQMMSGRQPAAVTCVAEDRWGDWRPHLAMMLSNHTQKPELDRKSITTLGDTLASRGFLHASHFCYLMSQTSFGSYSKKSSKIVLIGSSHGLPLKYFATDEAIQCTEIYEYALTLGNALVNLTNFQMFKYLYATRLADYGYAQEALQYCEVISRHINIQPAFYQHILVKLVYDLSCQLKYSHPQLQEEEDVPDPDWLRNLHTTLVQFEEGAIQPVSGTATPAYFGGRTTASSDSGEVGMYMQGADNGTMYQQDSSYQPTNGPMSSIHENYQQHPGMETSSQHYQQQGTQYGNVYDTSQTQQYSSEQPAVEGDNQYQQHYPQGEQAYQPHGHTADGQHGTLQWPEQSAGSQHTGYDSANQNSANSEQTNQNTENFQHQNAGNFSQYGTGHADYQSHWGQHQTQFQKTHGFHPDVNLGESQTSVTSTETAKRSSLASTSNYSQDGQGDEGDDQVDSAEPAPSIFDIQPAQQKIIAPKLRKRTISETSNGSTAGRERHPSGNRGQQQQQQKSADQDSLSHSKPKAGASGGGLFAKIGGLFSRKNEMKLPDDKEPSIVWDPVKKRWVDKDAGEEEEKPAAPPPKDHELKGSDPGSQTSGPVPGPAASRDSLPPSGNKFSIRRGPKYVDVMNPKPSGTSQVPSSLFHTLPSSKSAPAIFNPLGNLDGSSADIAQPVQDSIPEEKSSTGAENSNVSQNHSGKLQLPPVTENLSRNSSASSLSKEVQRILSKTTASSSSAPDMNSAVPTMFNPAQFQANQTFKQPTAPAPGHRLTNRRVYPK